MVELRIEGLSEVRSSATSHDTAWLKSKLLGLAECVADALQLRRTLPAEVILYWMHTVIYEAGQDLRVHTVITLQRPLSFSKISGQKVSLSFSC